MFGMWLLAPQITTPYHKKKHKFSIKDFVSLLEVYVFVINTLVKLEGTNVK